MNYPNEINLQAYQYEKNNSGKEPVNLYGAYRSGAKGLLKLLDEHIINTQLKSNDEKVLELQKIVNEFKK